MNSEKNDRTVNTFESKVEDVTKLQADLLYSELENKKYRRLNDILIILLFLIFIAFCIL